MITLLPLTPRAASHLWFPWSRLPILLNFQSIKPKAFQCNRYKMKVSYDLLDYQFTIRKTIFFDFLRLCPPKITENPNFYVCLSFHLLQKMHKVSNWWHFLYGFDKVLRITVVLENIHWFNQLHVKLSPVWANPEISI